jgi:hypothetical protein
MPQDLLAMRQAFYHGKISLSLGFLYTSRTMFDWVQMSLSRMESLLERGLLSDRLDSDKRHTTLLCYSGNTGSSDQKGSCTGGDARSR